MNRKKEDIICDALFLEICFGGDEQENKNDGMIRYKDW